MVHRKLYRIVVILLVFASVAGAAGETASQINAAAGQAIEQGQLQKAIAQLEPAVRRFPNDLALQFNLGLALLRSGRFDKAVAPLQKATADRNFSDQAHFLLGVDYFETKQFTQAISHLSGVRAAASAERTLYMLEESYRLTGQMQAAQATFHQLITRYPDAAWTHYLMGTAYQNQQEPDKAQAEYREALAKDPTMPNIDFAIGYLYFRQEDRDNARIWLQKEAVRGCHSLANYYLGEIARDDKQVAEAEHYYRQALVCDPKNSDAHLRLGMLFEAGKRYPEAIAQLDAAIRLKPDNAPAHYHLASVYRLTGKISAAQAEFAKVRQIQTAR